MVRSVNKSLLVASFGVSGDTARGSYWWVGGEDRINIAPSTGHVTVNNNLNVFGYVYQTMAVAVAIKILPSVTETTLSLMCF